MSLTYSMSSQITMAQNDIRPFQQDLFSSRSGSVISHTHTDGNRRALTEIRRTVAFPPRTPSHRFKTLEFDHKTELQWKLSIYKIINRVLKIQFI